MKILFCARHFGYLRNFESVIELLADRGHQVHLVADREESIGGKAMVVRLAARHPSITYGWTPSREEDAWFAFATKVRLAQDYLRYLDRRYDRAPKLRQRAKERTPSPIVWLVERAGLRYRPGRAALRALLRMIELAIPRPPDVDTFMRVQQPDVVLLTPLIDLGSPQLDLLKSARALGLKTVLCVGSWDHLSSKALIWIVPDLITVWNDIQKAEAVELHGVPANRVVVTGAQCFDQWFSRRPDRTREAFCRDVGLPADRPYILYVCSSLFRGGPTEAQFVESWIQAIRSSPDPRLRHAGILVRPHPGRMDEWEGRDVGGTPQVAFYGHNPIDAQAKADYFDSLYYSAAVVGLNTSAFLEAGIVGRPVFTILHEDYWKSQEGTLHFHYLVNAEGGLLQTARSVDEHLSQLARLLAAGETREPVGRRFVKAFLRPGGLDQPATPRFVEAIEQLGAAAPPRPVAPRVWVPVVRLLLSPLAHARRWRADSRRRRKELRHAARKAWLQARRQAHPHLQIVEKSAKLALSRVKRLVIPRTEVARARVGTSFDDLEEARIAKEAITLLGRSRGPILMGPWLSEVGFELIYWIPFLAWAKIYGNLRADRLIALSRGGPARWYRHLTPHYRDIFEFIEPGEFRVKNDRRIAALEGQKHFAMTELDEEIVDRVKRSMDLTRITVLHPSLMYNLFRLFWLEQASLDLVETFTRPRLVAGDAGGLPIADLPADYVAAKFYSNKAFPDTPDNARFVVDLIRALSERHHVVLLSTGLQLDDHGEFPATRADRVHVVDQYLTPRTNLEVQTAIIARARALVGTYGGFSYLGPLCGVDTLTFYSDAAGFRFDHLELAKRRFQTLGAGSFVALHRGDVDVLGLGLGEEEGRLARSPSVQ